MKKYTTDMMKLIALLVATPLLVMVYTKLEKTISGTADQTQGVTGTTPASIGLIDKAILPVTKTNRKENDEYILVRHQETIIGANANQIKFVQNIYPASRFTLILL
ncbi:MAG: hypothetical protein ABIS69_12265 [Sediminibacterium sp.]